MCLLFEVGFEMELECCFFWDVCLDVGFWFSSSCV